MVGAMMGNQEAHKREEDDSDIDDGENFQGNSGRVSGKMSDMLVRMASSGDTESIETVRMTYELRELWATQKARARQYVQRHPDMCSSEQSRREPSNGAWVMRTHAVTCMPTRTKVSGRANANMVELSTKLDMTEVEVRACYVAFLAYDVDGSGMEPSAEGTRAASVSLRPAAEAAAAAAAAAAKEEGDNGGERGGE